MPRKQPVRRICFVTGTRAEFGLMASTLRVIRDTPGLLLQIVVTGMHLDPKHGGGIDRIKAEGWKVDATVPWSPAGDATSMAVQTGEAMARLAETFAALRSDIVLVVGDRVEAFAAAAAGHLAGRVVAHVHGGDRALGQVDDSLRHAITKLAHLHFPATAESAARIVKLGEDRWRVHRVGSPGLDGIRNAATAHADVHARYGVTRKKFALVALHPTESNAAAEARRATMLLDALTFASGRTPLPLIVIGPNNDPGSAGVSRGWARAVKRIEFNPDLPRGDFLGLLRDAAFLIGNSSSGVIEAASFGTPVIDVGDRQKGRQRGENVRNVPFGEEALRRAIASVWREGRPIIYSRRNLYGDGKAGGRIARTLRDADLGSTLRRKLIAY